MAYEHEENEYYEEDDYLLEQEIQEVQAEYQRKKLLESLIGPGVSTIFHVILIIILAILIIPTSKEPPADIEITLLPDEPVVVIPPKVEVPKVEPDPEIIKSPDVSIQLPNTIAEPSKALDEVSEETPETDDDLDQKEILDTVATPSATAVYMDGGRTSAGIKGGLKSFGAGSGVHPQFIKALEWLAKVQSPDGSWGSDAKSAYTGLALLTFLAHGETHLSKRYSRTVKSAMQWLINDPINTNAHHGYPHAVKTYALCEAYGMTQLSMLEAIMNKCVKILIDGQQKGGSYDYNYSSDQGRQDLSFAGWNFQALKAASLSGCTEPGLQDAIYKAVDYLKKVGGSSQSFAYTTANNDPAKSSGAGKWTMRSVGVLCLQLFGHGKAAEITDELDRIIAVDLPKYNYAKAPSRSLYGWYYATNAMFQAQGKHWKAWRKHFERELLKNQHEEGYWVYPGNGHSVGDELSQKVYATTLNALQLSVYFRYLPTNNTVVVKKVASNKQEGGPVDPEEGLSLVD